jgi:hypothetical protein
MRGAACGSRLRARVAYDLVSVEPDASRCENAAGARILQSVRARVAPDLAGITGVRALPKGALAECCAVRAICYLRPRGERGKGGVSLCHHERGLVCTSGQYSYLPCRVAATGRAACACSAEAAPSAGCSRGEACSRNCARARRASTIEAISAHPSLAREWLFATTLASTSVPQRIGRGQLTFHEGNAGQRGFCKKLLRADGAVRWWCRSSDASLASRRCKACSRVFNTRCAQLGRRACGDVQRCAPWSCFWLDCASLVGSACARGRTRARVEKALRSRARSRTASAHVTAFTVQLGTLGALLSQRYCSRYLSEVVLEQIIRSHIRMCVAPN